MKKLLLFLCLITATLGFIRIANAEQFGGVEFPDGAVSFADAVFSYDPYITTGTRPSDGATVEIPIPITRNPLAALGVPDWETLGHNPPRDVCLGSGGSITLQFVDNSLTGSGSSAYDLWIFEVGPDVEDTFVQISRNGVTWYDVGKVFGSTSGIDIDYYGFGTSDFFSFVRLTDDPNEGDTWYPSPGADIDAVGAISSGPPQPVPEPATMLLLGSGLVGMVGLRRKFRKS